MSLHPPWVSLHLNGVQKNMTHITIQIDQETDAILKELAARNHRSKRSQLTVMAVEYAKQLLPNFNPKKRGAR